MSEENMMTEESKKTVISFIAGLLVGGLLVFIFSEPAANNPTPNATNDSENSQVSATEEVDEMEDVDNETVVASSGTVNTIVPSQVISDGVIVVANQDAGEVVELDSVEFPADAGWIGVRDYENGQMTGLLGVSRFNLSEGLTPDSVRLLRATVAGKTYAVIFYADNGDKTFSLANDAQLTGVMETFEAK